VPRSTTLAWEDVFSPLLNFVAVTRLLESIGKSGGHARVRHDRDDRDEARVIR